MPRSFQKHYITLSEINQGVALYIINSVGIAYHQHGVLYIIIAKADTACG